MDVLDHWVNLEEKILTPARPVYGAIITNPQRYVWASLGKLAELLDNGKLIHRMPHTTVQTSSPKLFSGSCVSVMFVVQAFDGGRKLTRIKGLVEVFIETGSERRVSIGSGGIGGQRNYRRIPDLWPLFFAKGCDECIPIVIRHADVCDYDINQL